MSETLAAVIAAVPIVALMLLLGVLRVPSHKAVPATLLGTALLAVWGWHMGPLAAASAAAEGAALGLWPIFLVILAAIFTHNLAVFTRSMDTIKAMLSNVSSDRRVQVLILAWGFGGFLEAVAGFGTAVAIPASILAALGFEPLFAAVICLIANTVPTAFGAIGIPVITLARLTGLDPRSLGGAVALQLAPFIVIIPFVLVILTARGLKGLRGMVGVCLVSGLAFALPQVLVARFVGPELPALLGSVCSMVATVAAARAFGPRGEAERATPRVEVPMQKALTAWIPYLLIFALIVATSPLFPAVNGPLSQVATKVTIYRGAGAKPFTFSWITTPGVLILSAAAVGGVVQGAGAGALFAVLVKSLRQLTKSAVTVLSIVALAKVMQYSGMINDVARELSALTGRAYPLFAAAVGALGTFVTGSDTSSNVLFGSLQTEVARTLGVDPQWLAAANTSGATAGKMISPQSIAVATSATGLDGSEGKIFGQTLRFCAVYVMALGVLVYLGAAAR